MKSDVSKKFQLSLSLIKTERKKNSTISLNDLMI